MGEKIISFLICMLVTCSVFTGLSFFSENHTCRAEDIEKPEMDINASVTVSNEHLSIHVYDGGGFTGWTAPGDWIFYPADTSMFTVKVGSNVYDTQYNLDYYLTHSSYINPNNNKEVITVWDIPEGIHVEQHIELVGEQAKFRVYLRNDGGSQRTVSIRYLWDTQIADNDGSPLREEGGNLHYFEVGFGPVNFNYWSAYARPDPGSLVTYASWDNTPNKIVFAHWPVAIGTSYDYSWSSSRRFYTPGYTYSPYSDSCVLMYWKDMTLLAGGEKNIVSYYGTTVGGGINVALSLQRNLYNANEEIPITVQVKNSNGNYINLLSKNNFQVLIDGNNVNIKQFIRYATKYILNIDAPSSPGSHILSVRVDTSIGWGTDSESIFIGSITSVTLNIGRNRLTDYENSADTPIYYRNSMSNYPIFDVDISVSGATVPQIKDYIEVYAEIQDFNTPPVKDKVYVRCPHNTGNRFSGNWFSPNNYPVGKYKVTALIKDKQDNLLKSSTDTKYFYLIFKPPTDKTAFVTEGVGCDLTRNGFGGYNWHENRLHQFSSVIWIPVLNKISGTISISEAAGRLRLYAHNIDDSRYGYWHIDNDERNCNHGEILPWQNNYPKQQGANCYYGDALLFLGADFDPENRCNFPNPTGLCVDYAYLQTAYCAAAGIPARMVNGWTPEEGHAWVEVYDNNWVHYDPTWNTDHNFGVYVRSGYQWDPVWTKKSNPGSGSLNEDRKNMYDYIAETTSIQFDKSDYDYPDPITVDVTVKNTGNIDITTDHLHLQILDHPTILTLGPSHLIDDIQITNDLLMGQSQGFTRYYQLPDYGILNGLYELIGDRSIITLIKYYNNITSEDYIRLVDKKEKLIPGLCNEWNPEITIDGSNKILDIQNLTSVDFDENLNESTDFFSNLQNTSAIIEHNMKHNNDYNRERWNILNTDNCTHYYSLKSPLLGIGNAAYIPNYGSVISNQTLTVNTDYLVIYNTTTSTNGLVNIFMFSKNITLQDVCILNGVVKIVGLENFSLAQQSGVSYLTYSSMREGMGLEFSEIYYNFSNEIVNNHDSLTQYLIEGEYSQISYYKFGDILQANVNISNNGISDETRNITLNIIKQNSLGSNNNVTTISEDVIYTDTQIITIPAKNSMLVSFQYLIPYNSSEGIYKIIVTDDITKAEKLFVIQSPFNVSFNLPSNIKQGEEFYINVNITNVLTIVLTGVNITLELPNDFTTTENLSKNIEYLHNGESSDVSWTVNATDFEYGDIPLKININTSEGISSTATTSIDVLRLPELIITPITPLEIQLGIPFELTINVLNDGDISLQNVIISLIIPENITVSEDLTISIGDLAGGETKSVSWTITSTYNEDFCLEISANDSTGLYGSSIPLIIKVAKVEFELNVSCPVEKRLNDEFNIIASVKNIGEISSTGVLVNLSLPVEVETTNLTSINIGNLNSGEEKQIIWVVKGVNPGVGEIGVSVTGSDSISVSIDILISHFPITLETNHGNYLQGENVFINTNISNENPEVSYIDLSVNLSIQGPDTNEIYSKPILYIDTLETKNIQYTWDTTGRPYGTYTVTARIEEEQTLYNETMTSFQIISPDSIPPITIKTVGEPKYGPNDEWITSFTEFNLTASDNIGGSGVDTTHYRIWYNGVWTPLIEYLGNFTLSGEGKHYLEYYSVDNAGNIETIHNQTHYVDDTPPTVIISATLNILWPPNHKMKNVLISGFATDTGSGIASITFAVDDEYNLVEPLLTCFGQIIQLEAWRNGNDKDGRTYTITATATDNLGHVTTASTIVRVPHDQGN